MQLWNVPNKDRGFTLTEVLVVSIIFSILAAVAVPNLLGMIHNARATEGISTVEGAIKEAQRQAKRLSKTCKIKFGTTTVTTIAGVENRVSITTVASTDLGEVGTPNYSDCLLEDRILPTDILAVNNIPVPATDAAGNPTPAGTPVKIAFSAKGSTDTNGTIKVYHPNSSTQTEKCLVLDGIFGDIATGIHNDTDSDRTTIEVCDTN